VAVFLCPLILGVVFLNVEMSGSFSRLGFCTLLMGVWLCTCQPAGTLPVAAPLAFDTEAQRVLGRYLFFSTRLSANGTRSCGSCHDPDFAFTDGYRQSPGAFADPTRRNAPTLLNAVYAPALDWADPNIRTFEQQMLRPLFGQSPIEMGLFWPEYAPNTPKHPYTLDLKAALDHCHDDTLLHRLYRAAWPDANDTWSLPNVIRSIAAYERTLVAMNSPFDAYLRGDTMALTAAAQRGYALFRSEAWGCAKCHYGPQLTDNQYHNIGLSSSFDKGLGDVTGRVEDIGKFRTPTLRNVMLTAPYFHDGSVHDIAEVIAIFASGGKQNGARVARHLQKFQRTPQEQIDLIHFLRSLTDTTYLTNTWYHNPYEL
jgi:cytochrome c peroxidase